MTGLPREAAAPAARLPGPSRKMRRRATKRTGGTRRAPAQTGLAIEFLLMFGVRSKAAAAVGRARGDSGQWRCAGSEEDIGREERCRPPPAGSEAAARVIVGRREESYRDGAVVAQREADLAIVVGHAGMTGEVGAARVGRPSGAAGERRWVMMPAEQDGLDQDREGARQQGNPAPCSPSPTDQDPRRAAPRISILRPPRPANSAAD